MAVTDKIKAFINGDNKRDNNQRDGYVYGQSVRGASKEFKEWVLADGYTATKIKDEDGHESRLPINPVSIPKNSM